MSKKYSVPKPIIQSVIVEWEGFEIEVTGEYEEGDPGVWTYSNGDPGYPSTPSCFYIESISLVEGELKDLLESVQNLKREDILTLLENLAIDKIEEQ